MPIMYSTPMATRTTNVEMMKPCSMGLAPERQSDLKLVFRPMAARAATIRNLLMVFRPETSPAGRRPRLVSRDMARNARMNQGKMERMRTLTPLAWALSFFFRCRLMAAKTRTAGMIASVRVSLTIVAKSPAASLKA